MITKVTVITADLQKNHYLASIESGVYTRLIENKPTSFAMNDTNVIDTDDHELAVITAAVWPLCNVALILWPI